MLKKINLRLIGAIILSLADEVIILAVVIIVLSKLGIDFPLWAIILVSLPFLFVTLIIYRSLRKNPQLGFENMVGLTGVAVETIWRKGTIRIKGELWSASARGEKIEAGEEVIVVEQIGLKLTVIKNPGASSDIRIDKFGELKR
jgi:membrane-bound ClpP family serine protease